MKKKKKKKISDDSLLINDCTTCTGTYTTSDFKFEIRGDWEDLDINRSLDRVYDSAELAYAVAGTLAAQQGGYKIQIRVVDKYVGSRFGSETKCEYRVVYDPIKHVKGIVNKK